MEVLQKVKILRKYMVLFILCAAVFYPLCVRAAEPDEEVTIYGLNSSYLEKITIPDSLPQSYQLTIGDGQDVTYSISSGSSAKVSADGLITPQYTYWKKYSGYSTTVREGEDYDYYTISAGDTKITARTADTSYTITVHVKDYVIVYGDEVMEAYISRNITEGMTDYEIMEAVVKFPAGYDYSASYSGVYSMIVNGGGDCWASTSAIITLCDKLGIKAWSRNGNKDPGAGSGHRNAMAELNGTYYELEAGYSMSKGDDGYRPYDVIVRDTLFSYYSSSSGVTVYQYDGYDTTGVLEVPETINGKAVTGIYKSAFSSTRFSEIRLPDTLTSIGDFAFSSCNNLTDIEIPASVTSIGASIFSSCKCLTNISIASDSTSYQVIDQAIYSKDGKTLVTCPAAGQITIPATVTKIADYAFYYNTNLQRITIPEAVTEMGEGAFGNCSDLSSVTIEGNGLTKIGTHCFRYDSSLSIVRLPASVKALGAYAFSYCSKLKYIYFMGDTPEFGETIDGTFYDKVFYSCTANAYYPEGNATWTEDVLTNHDGTITWSAWAGTEAVSIAEAELSLEQSSYTYTGSGITPAVIITLDDKTLTLNEDYIVNYTDNVNAGTAVVTVTGIGSYSGDISTSFTIAKAERSVRAYVRNDSIMEKDTTDIYYVSAKGDYTYTSDNPAIVAVDADGVISGISAGTAVITVQVGETENYLAANATLTITVTHDSDMVIADSTVTDGRVKMKCPRCNEIFTATVPTGFQTYWSLNNASYYSSYCGSNYEVGDILECYCFDNSSADLGEMEIISQDSSVVMITDNRYLNFIADGVAKVEIRPKYNPSIGREYTFYVGSAASGKEDKEQEDILPKDDLIPKEDVNAEKKEDNKTDAGEKVNCYDQKTGIAISVTKGDKKNAALIAMDKKYAKGSLVIPDTIKINGTTYTITAIAKAAFKNNRKITKVTIGNNIKNVEEEAFSGCKNLKTVKLGKNITTIGNKAFYNCSRITSITIPSKVNKIGKQAFAGCKKLKKIVIKTIKLTSKNVGSKAFTGIPSKAVIKVPKSKLTAYKTLLRKKGVSKKATIKK